VSSYHSWRPHSPTRSPGRGKPPLSAGPAPLASREAAIADALKPSDAERIRAEAVAAAAEALAAWDEKKGRLPKEPAR
jgi:hypothetical protein